uniref:Uncharacterized protein n=1 Tax=Clastoptera arizonana TaxID=38151 RepID=A0A1B6CIY8_9HEMI
MFLDRQMKLLLLTIVFTSTCFAQETEPKNITIFSEISGYVDDMNMFLGQCQLKLETPHATSDPDCLLGALFGVFEQEIEFGGKVQQVIDSLGTKATHMSRLTYMEYNQIKEKVDIIQRGSYPLVTKVDRAIQVLGEISGCRERMVERGYVKENILYPQLLAKANEIRGKLKFET